MQNTVTLVHLKEQVQDLSACLSKFSAKIILMNIFVNQFKIMVTTKYSKFSIPSIKRERYVVPTELERISSRLFSIG